MSKKDENKDENKKDKASSRTPEEILKSILDSNLNSHWNYTEDVDAELLSTGSLALDYEFGGGIRSAGLVRFVGHTEGGKTSESLEIMRDFLKKIKNGRGLYIKSEGRMSPEMIARCGLTFVKNPEEWKDGNIFILDTQEFELIVDLLNDLLDDEKQKTRYCIIIDSMDALRTKHDREKKVTDVRQVAGAATLTKEFLKILCAVMNKLGHLCIMIGQVSSKIEIDHKNREVRQISATGGNAALHWSNWILQFEARNKDDRIIDNPKEPWDSEKNKIRGHWCNVTIKKSPNETTGKTPMYPIKYHRMGCSSIWREYEIVEYINVYGFAELKGAGWYSVSPEILADLKNKGLDMNPKHQGADNFRAYLEQNKKIADYLYDRILAMMLKNPTL